jgi:hypothetical protein
MVPLMFLELDRFSAHAVAGKLIVERVEITDIKPTVLNMLLH